MKSNHFHLSQMLWEVKQHASSCIWISLKVISLWWMSLRGQVVRNKYGSQVEFTCSVMIVGCILHNVMQCDVNNAQCSVHLAQCPVNKVPCCVAFNPIHNPVEIYLQAQFHTCVAGTGSWLKSLGNVWQIWVPFILIFVFQSGWGAFIHIYELTTKRTRINDGKQYVDSISSTH